LLIVVLNHCLPFFRRVPDLHCRISALSHETKYYHSLGY
jgi:hypothetical protein